MLDEILTKHPEVDYVQLQINYLDWEDQEIQARACYEVAVKHGKKIMVMEPIKGGSLAKVPEAEAEFKRLQPDLSVASWAIRFAASLEQVDFVLSGMSNLEQVKDNMSYMEEFIPLSIEEQKAVEHGVIAIRENIAIPCTACRYCTENESCPKNIAIPEYFALYNNFKRFQEKSDEQYANLAKDHGRPKDCITCRKREKEVMKTDVYKTYTVFVISFVCECGILGFGVCNEEL